ELLRDRAGAVGPIRERYRALERARETSGQLRRCFQEVDEAANRGKREGPLGGGCTREPRRGRRSRRDLLGELQPCSHDLHAGSEGRCFPWSRACGRWPNDLRLE